MLSRRSKHKSFSFNLALLFSLVAVSISLHQKFFLRPTHAKGGIAVIDGDRLWGTLPASIELKNRFNSVLSKQQKLFAMTEGRLREENQELIRLQQTYNGRDASRQREIDGRQKAFTEKVIALQKKAEETQKSVNESYQKAMKMVKEQVARHIHRLSNKRGYTLVIYKSQTPYFEENLDITDDLLSLLKDVKVPEINIE